MFRGLLISYIFLLAACTSVGQFESSPVAGTSTTENQNVTNESLLVATAASVQFAFVEIGQRFSEETGQPVDFSFGSSGNLTAQIENGAPFDVFAAANVAFVDRLEQQGLIFTDTQQLYAQGRIVLAVNRAAGIQAIKLEDLLDPAINWVAIANPELAPYGQAAEEALQKVGILEDLQPKLVMAENIRQALQFVQTGDAPVGIIALAIADVPEVTYTLLPANLHNPLDQSMAVIKSSRHESTARAFLEFVLSSEGQAILEKYGFQSPGGF
jgi:molybdate transport system substrate-binding protein